MLNRVLDFPRPTFAERLPGFRLRRLEVFNWGTFHQKVAVLAPEGRWTLVVGENGSGKTTAVDALRTVLVPPRLLQYNDASGEQKRRDRTRRSYVRGAWATTSQDDTAAARVEYLRKPGEQSILLAVFSNELSGAEVTLAQVLWEANEKIDEIYAVARSRKSIKEDLSNLGQSHQLKRALRARGFEPYDSFAGYEEVFRSRLGIPSRGALEVFNQAIGVKEIADVNTFIRRHMLEPSQAVEFISSHLQPHYRELDACYQAIQKARAQIDKLEPIAQGHRRIEEAQARKGELEVLQQAMPLYFAHRHLQLRRAEASHLRQRLEELGRQQTAREEAQAADTEQRIALELDLASDAVGLRLKTLEIEQEKILKAKREKEECHQAIRRALETMQKSLPFDTPEAFLAMHVQVSANKALYEGNRDSARTKQLEAEIEQRDALAERDALTAELDNLRQQRVLIPLSFVGVRRAISQATGVAAEDLPFAGELVEVKSEFREWTGAIERLLRSFGVSLLVPEKHYLAVARVINARHLGLRLSFHRVPAHAPASRAEVLNQTDRVPARLNFREEHALHSWVKAEVCRRFDHVCCADVQRLKEVDFGLTREGLIRSGPTQHIKDDSKGIHDVTNYVLGWSTESKIRAVAKAHDAAANRAAEARKRAAVSAQQVTDFQEKLAAVSAVLAVGQFAEVDYRSQQAILERLVREREELEASSDRRKTLKKQLEELVRLLTERQRAIVAAAEEIGSVRGEEVKNAEALQALIATLAPHEPDAYLTHAPALTDLQDEKTLVLPNVNDVASAVGRKIQQRLNLQTSVISKVVQEMLPQMSDFLRDYPEETADKKAAPEYATEFAALQERLQHEDLPKHQQEFERFLSLNLIGDMAMFSTKLDEHRRDIEKRIAVVNGALRTIAFTEATHVQIVVRPKSAGDETAAFRAELKACLAGGLNPSPEDRVRIFGHIRELISKFQRDEGWTQRVTDARNWLEFGVREHADEDGREINYYSASSGKSGGQKTKLAFTILASAITAQYGLIDPGNESATFRFVIIDEAFARTDETNSERALQLFRSLGLQLLVVSPFDAKSRLVEDYVNTFHLALNPDGNDSHIKLASRAEYEEARESTPSVVTHAEPR